MVRGGSLFSESHPPGSECQLSPIVVAVVITERYILVEKEVVEDCVTVESAGRVWGCDYGSKPSKGRGCGGRFAHGVG